MAYDFRVVFSGILAVFRHEDNADGRVMVVVPRGLKGDLVGPGRISNPQTRESIDGETLNRHFGMVRFDASYLTGSPSGIGEFIRYLDGEHVTFSVGGGPVEFTSTRLIPFRAAIDPQYELDADLCANPPSGKVLAQIELAGGLLADDLTDNSGAPNNAQWILSNKLGGQGAEGVFTAKLVWTVRGVEGPVSMMISPFGSEKVTPIELNPDGHQGVEVTVTNLCDDNPLMWDMGRDEVKDDIDFRWYYELLSTESYDAARNAIQEGGIELPIPRSIQTEPGGGQDCMPGYLGEASF